MGKKLLSILLAVFMLMVLVPTNVFAQAQPIGDSSVTWELTNNSTVLTIGGTGAMPNFNPNYAKLPPWDGYQDNITSIIIGSDVTLIGAYAFEDCSNLIDVTVNAITPPELKSYVFKNTNNNFNIYVPAGSVDAYKSANNWSGFASRTSSIPTVGDVLNTIPGGFPTTEESGWINENGKKSYVNDNILTVSYNVPLESVLQKDGNDYKSSDNGKNVTFVMTSGVLTSIIVSGAVFPVFDGTYHPQTPVAQIGNITYLSLSAALSAAQEDDVVKLLVDLNTSEDINVKEDVIFDLNGHTINTTGTVTNKGVIALYNKNASIIDYLLYDVKGAYGASEELNLPDSLEPKYIVPKGTFVIANVDENGNQILSIASGDDYLVWNEDVKKGTQLKVGYSLALGGDIIASDNAPEQTCVETTNLKLNKDITIGSNNVDAGYADLSVLSIIDEEPELSTWGSIASDSHKIIINETGSLTVSDDISFDESIVVSGKDGMAVEKVHDEANKIYSFVLMNEQKYENKPFEIIEGNIRDLEFVTSGTYVEDGDVIIKVDNKLVDPSNYSLAHGSTHITLHKDFINTLIVGKHTMSVAILGYNTISQDFVISGRSPGRIVPNTSVR